MNAVRFIRKFRRLSRQDLFLLTEAVWSLGISWVTLRLFPFRRIAPRLGTVMAESPRTVSAAARTSSERVGWAIRTASRYVPWPSRCLVQAMAAKQMLRRRRQRSTLYLAMKHNPDGDFLAHAWLRSGDVVLTGAEEASHYTVLSTFA